MPFRKIAYEGKLQNHNKDMMEQFKQTNKNNNNVCFAPLTTRAKWAEHSTRARAIIVDKERKGITVLHLECHYLNRICKINQVGA